MSYVRLSGHESWKVSRVEVASQASGKSIQLDSKKSDLDGNRDEEEARESPKATNNYSFMFNFNVSKFPVRVHSFI